MRSSSRLNRRLERKTQKNIVLTFLGIAIFLFLIFKFGIPLLVNLSLLLSNNKSGSTASSNSGPSFVEPPTLNPTYDATNSATLQSISGNGMKGQTITLYVNDNVVDKTTVQSDGTFSFKDIALQSGDNTIKAKASTDNNKESDFSNTLTVTYKNSAPKLTIDSPDDGHQFTNKDNNPITVSGKTDPGDKVTVNDFWALVDGNGNYSYNLTLQNGDNHVTIIATDPAGNTTKMERTVKYSQ